MCGNAGGKIGLGCRGSLAAFLRQQSKAFSCPALLNWHVIYTAGPLPVEHRKLGLPQKVMTSVRLAPSSVLTRTPEPAQWSQAVVADQRRRFQFLARSSSRINCRGHKRSHGHLLIAV